MSTRTETIELRSEIVRIGRLMYDKGFICASDGNISARLGSDRVLITPSGLHKGFLEPEDLLVVDMDGQVIPQPGFPDRGLRPTSELPMHLEAYRQRPDVGGVVHAHPPLTIALSIADISLASYLLPEVIVMLGVVPTTPFAMPSSDENRTAISDLVRCHDGIVLRRHGSLTVGRTPMAAFMQLETLEQQARITFMLAQLGVSNPLAMDQVERLLATREAMGLNPPGAAFAFCTDCEVYHQPGLHVR
jgi:L-fuculose-phosphate aldolase